MGTAAWRDTEEAASSSLDWNEQGGERCQRMRLRSPLGPPRLSDRLKQSVQARPGPRRSVPNRRLPRLPGPARRQLAPARLFINRSRRKRAQLHEERSVEARDGSLARSGVAFDSGVQVVEGGSGALLSGDLRPDTRGRGERGRSRRSVGRVSRRKRARREEAFEAQGAPSSISARG